MTGKSGFMPAARCLDRNQRCENSSPTTRRGAWRDLFFTIRCTGRARSSVTRRASPDVTNRSTESWRCLSRLPLGGHHPQLLLHARSAAVGHDYCCEEQAVMVCKRCSAAPQVMDDDLPCFRETLNCYENTIKCVESGAGVHAFSALLLERCSSR